MDYSRIINRAVNIVWENKYLIILGFLASLGSGSPGSVGGDPSNVNGGGGADGAPFGDAFQLPDVSAEMAGVAVGLIALLVCVVVVVGIVLWAISAVARGGLIAAVDTIESGGKSSFSEAWRAGWQKAWTLLGIGLLPAIPGFILLFIGLAALGVYGGFFALFGDAFDPAVGSVGVGAVVVLLACLILPFALVLAILRNFAERACMLEDLGVVDAYRRGWQVLGANLGEALILFLLQIAIFAVLAIVLFVPGIIIIICCFLWPLLLALQGAVTAFVSAIWTLAWRVWTGKGLAAIENSVSAA